MLNFENLILRLKSSDSLEVARKVDVYNLDINSIESITYLLYKQGSKDFRFSISRDERNKLWNVYEINEDSKEVYFSFALENWKEFFVVFEKELKIKLGLEDRSPGEATISMDGVTR
jgi:hypothetical protein